MTHRFQQSTYSPISGSRLIRAMKLLSLLLLGIVAVAAAVPAPRPDSDTPDTGTPAPLVVDFPVIAGTSDNPPYFFPFNFTVYESCQNGFLIAQGQWQHKAFLTKFELDGMHSVFVKLYGKDLSMMYDYQRHGKFFLLLICVRTCTKMSPQYLATNYTYNTCNFSSNNQGLTCGICLDTVGWQGAVLDCAKGDTKATRVRLISISLDR